MTPCFLYTSHNLRERKQHGKMSLFEDVRFYIERDSKREHGPFFFIFRVCFCLRNAKENIRSHWTRRAEVRGGYKHRRDVVNYRRHKVSVVRRVSRAGISFMIHSWRFAELTSKSTPEKTKVCFSVMGRFDGHAVYRPLNDPYSLPPHTAFSGCTIKLKCSHITTCFQCPEEIMCRAKVQYCLDHDRPTLLSMGLLYCC